jgi:hypothetical protein
VEVLITNPELVKTGLDMLEFPTIVFLTTGYNVYTLQQAAWNAIFSALGFSCAVCMA